MRYITESNISTISGLDIPDLHNPDRINRRYAVLWVRNYFLPNDSYQYSIAIFMANRRNIYIPYFLTAQTFKARNCLPHTQGRLK